MASFSSWFVGFSDGTADSAKKDATSGGACTADPPLRLTLNVLGEPFLPEPFLPYKDVTCFTAYITSSSK